MDPCKRARPMERWSALGCTWLIGRAPREPEGHKRHSQCKIWEKIMRRYKSSLRNYMKCKKWNRITVVDCLTFPVNLQRFQVLVPCWATTNACLLTHGIHLDYRKTFLVINFPRLIILKSSSRNSLLRNTKRDRISSTSNRNRDLSHKRWQTK